MGFGWKLTHDEFIQNKSGRIEDIWVHPEHRRKGMCKTLLSDLVQLFATDGITLTLQYVYGNLEAEQICTRLGFHTVLKTANASFAEVEDRNLK